MPRQVCVPVEGAIEDVYRRTARREPVSADCREAPDLPITSASAKRE